MTPCLQTDPSSEHADVVLIADAYLRQATTASAPDRIDVVTEADALRRCALLFARRPRLLAITEAHDRTAQSAYAAAGFEVIHLNGNRAQALPTLVTQEIAALRQAPPQHLIVVSGDAAFSPLVQQALRRQTTVLVWWSGELPTALTDAACIVRDLERDVLAATRRTTRVAIYIDYENIHIGLERQGQRPSPQAILHAVRAESADLGRLSEIHAYADWQALNSGQHEDIQRELVRLGVKTHYQIGRHGKNCADMEITADVCAALELTQPGACVDALVLVTGDRDLLPTVRRVQLRGKRLRVLTLRQCLAHELKQHADEVRLLDPYFERTTELTLLTSLLRVVAYLRQHDFDWAPRDRLARIMQTGEGELASWRILNQAVAQAILTAGPSARPGSLTLNRMHPLTRLAQAIYDAVSTCCQGDLPASVTTAALRRCLGRRVDMGASLGALKIDAAQVAEMVFAAGIVLPQTPLPGVVSQLADDVCWRLAVIEDERRRQAA